MREPGAASRARVLKVVPSRSAVPSISLLVMVTRAPGTQVYRGVIAQRAGADFGPLQVLQNADGASQLGGDLAQGADALQVLVVGAMGEVEAGNIHAEQAGADESALRCLEDGPRVQTILARRRRGRLELILFGEQCFQAFESLCSRSPLALRLSFAGTRVLEEASEEIARIAHGVELRPDQDHQGDEVEPDEQGDGGAHRAVDDSVVRIVAEIPAEDRGGGKPQARWPAPSPARPCARAGCGAIRGGR